MWFLSNPIATQVFYMGNCSVGGLSAAGLKFSLKMKLFQPVCIRGKECLSLLSPSTHPNLHLTPKQKWIILIIYSVSVRL